MASVHCEGFQALFQKDKAHHTSNCSTARSILHRPSPRLLQSAPCRQKQPDKPAAQHRTWSGSCHAGWHPQKLWLGAKQTLEIDHTRPTQRNEDDYNAARSRGRRGLSRPQPALQMNTLEILCVCVHVYVSQNHAAFSRAAEPSE